MDGQFHICKECAARKVFSHPVRRGGLVTLAWATLTLFGQDRPRTYTSTHYNLSLKSLTYIFELLP